MSIISWLCCQLTAVTFFTKLMAFTFPLSYLYLIVLWFISMYQMLRNPPNVSSFLLSLCIIKHLICSRQIVKIKIKMKCLYNYDKLSLISRKFGIIYLSLSNGHGCLPGPYDWTVLTAVRSVAIIVFMSTSLNKLSAILKQWSIRHLLVPWYQQHIGFYSATYSWNLSEYFLSLLLRLIIFFHPSYAVAPSLRPLWWC